MYRMDRFRTLAIFHAFFVCHERASEFQISLLYQFAFKVAMF